MKKIGKAYFYKDFIICPNYGGWIVDHHIISDYNIYKTLNDAKNAILKVHDGTNKAEPRVIGKMTEKQFIHSFAI